MAECIYFLYSIYPKQDDGLLTLLYLLLNNLCIDVQASVSVGGAVVSSIQEGLCVLVGIKREDTAEDVEYIGK